MGLGGDRTSVMDRVYVCFGSQILSGLAGWKFSCDAYGFQKRLLAGWRVPSATLDTLCDHFFRTPVRPFNYPVATLEKNKINCIYCRDILSSVQQFHLSYWHFSVYVACLLYLLFPFGNYQQDIPAWKEEILHWKGDQCSLLE